MRLFRSKERKLSDRLKKEAIGLGLCGKWTSEWTDDTTRDELVDKFVNGIDFCVQHDWPSTEVMKKSFGDVIHKHGVYVDENVNKEDPDTLVLNGRCDGRITCGMFSIGNIYVRHKSHARVRVKDFAYVHISVYDDADVEVYCERGAKCFVYQYGGKVTATGSVTIRKRNLSDIQERTINEDE